MKVVWTPSALRDRRAIREFIGLYSPQAAIEFEEYVAKQVELLKAHPGLGRIGAYAGTRELVVHRHYLIVYRVADDLIRVLRVKHTSLRWPRVRS